ncbi:MAG TPA: undecaprenyl-diphosphate phosphatase [Candidatus Onthoplasma faecigallinarum]|nr:undecaprenyl-diphosphate phosphatase [Candidatus Onthoplasma faecigallinarum]
MIELIKYILIGFIQGLTEFLPISSSGHVVLFGSLFDLDNLLLLSVVAHVGTLFAVIFCYRKRLVELVKKPFNKTNINLLIATIPTVVIVLLFNHFIEDNFSTKTLIWGFLLSAVLLIIADFKKDSYRPVNKRSALYMGLAQGLALLPGISRSGSTLVCGLLVGVEKNEALDFSFLMSIPIIIASAVYESIKLFTMQLTVNWLGIFIVMITSFIFGILSIKLMLKIVKKNKLYFFSIYLIVLSLIILIFF